MDILKSESLLEFAERFESDEKCLKYLAEMKWEDGYTCKKCGHKHAQQRPGHKRCCNVCGHIESPTAGTLFHRLRFGIGKAFFILFEMSSSSRGLSASQVAKRYSITRTTAHFFMHKVRTAMKSSGRHPMEGSVVVDEFVLGGKEKDKPGRSYDTKKKKAVMALELTPDRKVKRLYVKQIADYSAAQLKTIFEGHISKKASVTTDVWKGYLPIKRDGYAIEQSYDPPWGKAFFEIHTMIHQVKSTVRTVYSWTSKHHTQRYFDEQCFRLNRSQTKKSILNSILSKMINHPPVTWKQLVGS